MDETMADTQVERDFYRHQCDEMGKLILRLQQELTQVNNDARRSYTTTSLVLKTYELINHEVSIEDIGKRFLQVILGTMWADRAMVLTYDKDTRSFTSQYSLGLENNSTPVLTIDNTVPEFLFINSNTESTPLTASISAGL